MICSVRFESSSSFADIQLSIRKPLMRVSAAVGSATCLTSDLNVFTLNKRSVMLIHANLGAGREAVPVAFVAVGG